MQRPAVLDAFAYPRFRRVWSAGLVSQLGDWMQIIGRAFLAFELTGKAESVGVIYFATYAPQLLFSLYGGVLADRFDRRRLLIGTQVAEAIGAAALGILAATGHANVANLAVFSFFMGTAFMLSIPTIQALQPAVVPREGLSSAISLGTATNSIARIFGPLLAALVISGAGIEWVFWVNAVSFLAVIVAWLVTPVERQPPIGEERNLAAIGAALRFVRRTPAVAVPIAATGFLMTIGIVYQPLAVVYATDVLADGAKSVGRDYFSWLQAGIGVGSVVGIVALAGVSRRRPAGTFVATAIIFSAALVVLGRVSTFGLALVVIVAVGGFHFANIALALTLVQHEVADAMRGRVMAIHMTALVGFIPFTSLAAGLIVDRVGIRTTFTGAGLMCLAFSLLLLRWGRHIRLREEPVDERERVDTAVAVGTLIEEEA